MYSNLSKVRDYRNLFSVCREGTLGESYDCCLKQCGTHRVCKALCRNIYPGSIPEDCAFEQGCMHAEYISTKCLDEKQYKYKQCCLERCAAEQWSELRALKTLFGNMNIVPVDCNDYCEGATRILVDTKYDINAPYD